jgi:hypothetical protein
MIVSLDDYVRGNREWDVTTGGHVFALRIDAKTGQLMSFEFHQRREEQYRGLGRTGKQKFSRTEDAKRYIVALAAKLQVPPSAKLTGFDWKKDGAVKDANTAGSVGSVFKDGTGRVVATISCDPQDGALVYFSRSRA